METNWIDKTQELTILREQQINKYSLHSFVDVIQVYNQHNNHEEQQEVNKQQKE
jgi:hypothetical protein